jgi:DNA-binding response OmpR family regulator
MMKVFFIENHARFAKVTVARFLALHEVEVVPSLAAARLVLAGSTFDAVLVDYDLDDGKGDELVRELQTQIHRPVIIAISSHESGTSALPAAGADAVCEKLKFSNIENVLVQAVAGQI